MKKIVLLLMVFLPIFVHGQISIRQAAEKKMVDVKYDSLENFVKPENTRALIGQSLYVIPISEGLRKYGYDGFYTKSSLEKEFIYKTIDKYSSSSLYEELVGRTFKVIDVIKQNGKYYGTDYILKIADDKDTLFYQYPEYESSYKMMVLGYYEKLKSKYVGNKYYFKRAPDKYWTDFETGEQVELIAGSEWTCTDIVLDSKYYNLKMLFKNNNSQTLSNEIERLDINFILKDYGDYLFNKYGELYKKAIAGKVVIGMAKELVVIAWGFPEKINSSSDGLDQWVYGNQYLYIQNGVLKSWN